MAEAKIRLSVDGAASVVGGLNQVGLKISDIDRLSTTAASSVKNFLGGLVVGAAGAVAAYMSIGSAIEKLKGSIDTLALLDDMSQKTGAAVENLSKLQKVAAMTGADFTAIDPAISKLAKGMATVDSETSKTHKALGALGISSKDLSGKMRDPSEVMVDVAKKLQGYADGAGKTALANDLLGKSGADLLPYLNDVAENVDKFSGSSQEAAQKASELQDKLGLMTVKSSELYTSIATELLPTCVDFIDALNETKKSGDKLYADGTITNWADDVALGLARVVDVAKILPALLSSVGGSFKVVAADASVAFAALHFDPENFKKVLAERNQIVADANKKYDDLWNKPANQMEQAILAARDARLGSNLDARDLQLKAQAAAAKDATEGPKKNLRYTTGNAPKNTATAEKISDYEKLTRSINEKIAADEMQLTVGRSLSDSEKILSKLLADRASGAIHLTGAEQSALEVLIKKHGVNLEVIESNKRAAEGAADMAKIFKDYQNTVTKSIDDAIKEAEKNEELARTFGMTKGAIEQLELARLEDRLAQRASVGMTLDEIETLEKLIDAKKRNAAAVGKTDALETADKANKALIADQEKTVEKYDGIFRNGFADMLNNGRDAWGSFTKSLTTTFKTTVADQMYKMFAQPFVVKMVASLLGVVGGSAVSGVANAATSGGIGGGMNMLSAGKSLWDGFSGGMTAGMGSGIAAVGNAFGASSVSAFGAGLAGNTSVGLMTASETFASAGMAAEASAASLGASVAAAVPYIAAAAAVAYVLKAGFGHGERETTSRGIEGSFGGSGFTGNNFNVWKEEGGWFSGDNNGRDTSALDSTTAKSFSNGYASLQAASINAAKALGLSADSISSYSEQISLVLTGDKAKDTEAITKLFTDLGDHMATAAAPGIDAFAKEGEAATATLARLSGSITTANAWLSVLKQRLFQVSLAGGDAASKLADAFGGLENLTAASKAFYDTYYTEGERAARSTADMTKALAAVNLSMPVTKDQLRSMAASLDLNTASGRAAYATLLAIAPEFSAVADITAKLAKETADKLIATFTGGGKLVPALDASRLKTDALILSMTASQLKAVALATGLSEAQIKAGALTASITGAGAAAGNISVLFLDAKSGLLSFGSSVSTLKPTLTNAQLSAILLNGQIDSLRLGADKTRINIAGLSTALAGVNTETFVTTIGLVFENLATRIQGVIDSISTERIALREAALQIINPTVMSKSAIEKGIAGVNTKLPSNAGVVSSLSGLSAIAAQQAALDKGKAMAISYYAPIVDSSLAQYNKSRSDSLNSLAAYKGLLNGGVYAKDGQTYGVKKASNYSTVEENFASGTKFRAGGYWTYGRAEADSNNAAAAYSKQFDAAKKALATYTTYSDAYTKRMAEVAAQQAALTTRANAAADVARKAQLAYADALQNFAIDASKSVGKLGKLREETVKYYEAQKQLADLMSNSAAGLRGTVADYKYSQLSSEQQFKDLQAKYATAYSMALSTDGEALAGYGDKLNSMLNPLLEKAKEVYGADSAYNAFAATALARAEAIAGRLETLTPTNYAADSLAMLGQIDSTLAALDASSKSAEKLITDAINAGSDKTAAGLHAVIAALTGQAPQAFATGGAFTNGVVSRPTAFNMGVMGEAGDEAIMPLTNIGGKLGVRSVGGGNTARLEALVERQTQELTNMRAELRAIAASNAKLARQGDRLEQDGLLVRTDADTPLATVAA